MARQIRNRWCSAAVLIAAAACVSSTGCRTLLATAVYMWNGGNVVPAEFEGLEKQRVVVMCRPPASYEYSNAGAARAIGQRVSAHLAANVKDIDLVSTAEVDNWIDEQDSENWRDLGHSVKATRVVYIELDDFDLYLDKTLYQGRADVTVSVYDLTAKDNEVFSRRLGQVLFPRNSGIPSADKPAPVFERQFVEVISQQVAEHFYKHDPNATYAIDAMANK
jgi:hypothetical protein